MSTPGVHLPPSLLALSPGNFAHTDFASGVIRSWRASVERAIESGLTGLLLREPKLPDRSYLALARDLQESFRFDGAWLALHDRPHLCRAAGVFAVHLGFRSLSTQHVLSAFPELTVGVSTHLEGEPQAGAHYRFFGPYGVVDKPGVPEHLRPARVSLEEVRTVCASGPPVWILGGVTPGDVPALGNAGAAGVVVRSRLLGAEDPAAAAAEFCSAFAADVSMTGEAPVDGTP